MACYQEQEKLGRDEQRFRKQTDFFFFSAKKPSVPVLEGFSWNSSMWKEEQSPESVDAMQLGAQSPRHLSWANNKKLTQEQEVRL